MLIFPLVVSTCQDCRPSFVPGLANRSSSGFQHWLPGSREIVHCGQERAWLPKYVIQKMGHQVDATRSE